jgi:hypothetical protein
MMTYVLVVLEYSEYYTVTPGTPEYPEHLRYRKNYETFE